MAALLIACICLLTLCAVFNALAWWVVWRIYNRQPIEPDWLSALHDREKKYYA